jgi:glutathione S-transferase
LVGPAIGPGEPQSVPGRESRSQCGASSKNNHPYVRDSKSIGADLVWLGFWLTFVRLVGSMMSEPLGSALIKLFGRGQSRSFRALWALNEADVPFEYVEVTDELRKSAEYLDVNPQGKVPTLIDGGLTLTESAAIVNYAGILAGSELIPSTPAARAIYDEICYFVMTDLEQPLWTIGKHRFALPEEQRHDVVIETATWEFAKSQRALQHHLGDREFAVGDSFTMADVLLAHTLNWAARFEMPVARELLQYRDQHYDRAACVVSLETVVV